LALLAALPTALPAPLALSPAPPTALRTTSTGLLPPLEPLLERDPFELGALELDDFEPDDFGLAAFFTAFGFAADFGFAAFDFDFGFAVFGLDCDFDWGFDFVDDFALFDADRFFDWVFV
jgi:hypothetical protein